MTGARVLGLWALAWLSGCGSCADLSVQKPFPCQQSEDDAVQCPTGWRCGLEGACFDAAADAGRAFACQDSARHCADGWRCGAPGGNGRTACQAVGVGGPYACRDNADCEADWRCDPVARTCTEVGDQLSLSRLSDVRVDVVSPRLPFGLPAFAAVGPMQAQVPVDAQRSSRGRVVGLVMDGGLHVITIVESASRAGGSPRVQHDVYGVDEAGLRQLAVAGLDVLARFADGTVWAWNRDGGPASVIDGGVRRLADFGTSEPRSAGAYQVAALFEGEVRLISQGGGVSAALASDDAGRPRDVAGPAGNLRVLFDSAVNVYDASGTLPLLSKPAPLPHAPGAFERLGLGGSYLVEATDAGGQWGFLSESFGLALLSGPCPVCPFGAPPLQVAAAEAGQVTLVARCPAEPAGGLPVARTWAVRLDQGTTCAQRRLEPVEEGEAPFGHGFVPGTTDLRRRAHAGAAGRAWYSEDYAFFAADELPPLHPVVLDRLPVVLTRLTLGGPSQVFALADLYTFSEAPVGLVSEVRPHGAGDFTILGTVAGTTQLLVATDGVFNVGAFPLGGDVPQRVAALGPGAPPLTPPATGTLVSLADGRRLLVVSSNDTLYGADVTLQLSSLADSGVDGTLLPPAELVPRLVPAPGVPVRDVALGETASGSSGSRALGGFYVLARNEVFAIEVRDLDTWSAVPIPLPADFGPPRELWTEFGRRGRVAFERGFIAALPTPVQLAPPLSDDGSVEAKDFARLCGDTFAIVGTGVQHFATDAGWVPVPGVTLTAAQAATARFFEAGPSTFLAAGDGQVWELYPRKDASGAPACP